MRALLLSSLIIAACAKHSASPDDLSATSDDSSTPADLTSVVPVDAEQAPPDIFGDAARMEAPSFFVGTDVHTAGYGASDLTKAYDAMLGLSLSTIRTDYNWSTVELSAGVYTFPANQEAQMTWFLGHGISPLLILDYGNTLYDGGKKPTSNTAIAAFVAYAKQVTTHFAGRITMYEVWNEWDGGTDPLNSAQNYMNLLVPTYKAIKAVDPNIKIFTGALSTPYLKSLLALGLAKYTDGISIHPYVHCAADPSPQGFLALVNADDATVVANNGGMHIPLYVTEMGWPTSTGAGQCGVPEAVQATDLSQAALLAHGVAAVKGFWVYDLRDDGTDITMREDTFGLVHNDFSQKPSYPAIQAAYKTIRSP